MRRRDVLGVLGGSVMPMLISPDTARAAGKVYRVAFVAPIGRFKDANEGDAWSGLVKAFYERMHELGYVDGKTMKFDFHSGDGDAGKLAAIGTRVLADAPDVIVAAGGGANEVAHVFKRLTSSIPVVIANSSDPVEQGLVSSLSRPGGNITGFTGNTGPEFEAKRLQLLQEVDPNIARVAYLGLKVDWESPAALGVRAAAARLGMAMVHAKHVLSDYERAFELIASEPLQGLFVARNPWNFSKRRGITQLAVERRLAAVYPTREFTEIGGLMSYGPNLPDLYRRAAGHVDKILNGAATAELSVEQPTKFELLFNMKTATALGLAAPPALLARADEVIE